MSMGGADGTGDGTDGSGESVSNQMVCENNFQDKPWVRVNTKAGPGQDGTDKWKQVAADLDDDELRLWDKCKRNKDDDTTDNPLVSDWGLQVPEPEKDNAPETPEDGTKDDPPDEEPAVEGQPQKIQTNHLTLYRADETDGTISVVADIERQHVRDFSVIGSNKFWILQALCPIAGEQDCENGSPPAEGPDLCAADVIENSLCQEGGAATQLVECTIGEGEISCANAIVRNDIREPDAFAMASTNGQATWAWVATDSDVYELSSSAGWEVGEPFTAMEPVQQIEGLRVADGARTGFIRTESSILRWPEGEPKFYDGGTRDMHYASGTFVGTEDQEFLEALSFVSDAGQVYRWVTGDDAPETHPFINFMTAAGATPQVAANPSTFANYVVTGNGAALEGWSWDNSDGEPSGQKELATVRDISWAAEGAQEFVITEDTVRLVELALLTELASVDRLHGTQAVSKCRMLTKTELLCWTQAP